MKGITLLVITILCFLVAYVTYGSWLAKQWDIDPKRKTPAHDFEDGVDYIPAKAPVLLGHHFASIAGAGPINGCCIWLGSCAFMDYSWRYFLWSCTRFLSYRCFYQTQRKIFRRGY